MSTLLSPSIILYIEFQYIIIMSDTWNEIQAEKNKQLSMREKLAMRRKEREQVVADVKSIANLRTASASTGNLSCHS